MRKRVFLLYVVMDMSQSMSREENGQVKIRTAMDIVPSIIESTKRNATVAAALRVSVIGFNQNVFELFEASKTIKDRHVYALDDWWKSNRDDLSSKCVGQTYFTKLFKELNQIIKRDQKMFDPKEYELYRPVVYFLTDFKPEGACETEEAVKKEFYNLVSEAEGMKAPAILAIGIGDAERRVVEQYAAGRVIGKWKFDEEKNKNVREYSSGEYRKPNSDMAFVFRGEKAARNLNKLNTGVVKSVINSIQQVDRQSNTINNQGPLVIHESDVLGGFEMLIDENELISK